MKRYFNEITKGEATPKAVSYFKSIDWNRVEDAIDKQTWEKLASQFWLDTRVPVSNDLSDWRQLSEDERDVVNKAFVGLTMLDTLQSEEGANVMRDDVRTQHEEAVLNNILFMESVHAKSYSTIFISLNESKKIDEIFEWGDNNKYLQYKAEVINTIYQEGSPLQKKVASVFLETFLFYSGFFTPLWYLGNAKLVNVAEIIKLIIRDECLTGDHELLTPSGWKKISEITEEDFVAQYNAKNKEISFAKPEKISSHFADKIYSFENFQGHVKIKCSPKHRMLFERKRVKDGEAYYEPEIVFAEDVTGTQLSASRGVLHGGKGVGPSEVLTPEQQLLVAIAADGNYDQTKNLKGELRRSGIKTGAVPVKFTFSKERKIERLQRLAELVGWTLQEGNIRKGEGAVKDCRSFTLYVPVEYADPTKRLDILPLDQISGSWAKAFIREIALWDGYLAEGKEDRITWGSVRQDYADYVQAVAALAGYRTHYKLVKDNRKETFSDYHKIQINTRIDKTGTQRLQKVELPGEQVYGVQVPHGFLLTRQNGSVTVTGNSVHGTYLGYKFQLGFNELSEVEQEELSAWVYDLLDRLMANEEKYTEELYQKVGWTEEVKVFIRYNANKALQNLGFPPFYEDGTAEFVNPIVMNGLSTDTSNHDFFSQVGSGYLMGQVEAMDEDDYSF